MKNIEQLLWSAFDNYRLGTVKGANALLIRSAEILLQNDETINNDSYLKNLSINVYTNIVLNNFYNNNGVSLIDIYAIVCSEEESGKNIDEFNRNFNQNNDIDIFKNITKEMLSSAIKLLRKNIYNVFYKNVQVYFKWEKGSVTQKNKEIIEFFDNSAIINEISNDKVNIKVIKELNKVKEYILENQEEIKKIVSNKCENYAKSSYRNDFNLKIKDEKYLLSANYAQMNDFYNDFVNRILEIIYT